MRDSQLEVGRAKLLAGSSRVAEQFDHLGYAIVDDVLSQTESLQIIAQLDLLGRTGPGMRNLLDEPWCRSLVSKLKANSRIANILPVDLVSIQCTLFDKTPEANWLVAIHQDLSVPVKQRVSHPALGVWSEKDDQLHVQAPVELLGKLIALRLHIDKCGSENGALRVVPGSHRHGRLGQYECCEHRDQHGDATCEVDAAGAMLMRPLLLHASSKARAPLRRRVLHFLFAPKLPGYGLQWQYSV